MNDPIDLYLDPEIATIIFYRFDQMIHPHLFHLFFRLLFLIKHLYY
jgi:hypothetical protein